jgi:hypothetical protein
MKPGASEIGALGATGATAGGAVPTGIGVGAGAAPGRPELPKQQPEAIAARQSRVERRIISFDLPS